MILITFKFINSNGITPFQWAVVLGNCEIVNLLLTNEKLDVNIPAIFNTVLFLKFQTK